MTIKFSDITGGGIPYGNNAGRPANPGIGKLYANGEAQRLELYTAQGWNNIVQETPGVASISGAYSEQTNSGTFTVSGTNFVSGCYATAIGSNGVQVDAASTSYNSIVQVTATFTNLSNAYEPYDVKITNPSNLFGILPDALYINASPVWQTAIGSLGTFEEQVSVSVSAVATDSDSTITYSLTSGALPSGVTLNSSTGLISGMLPDIVSNTTYNFVITASDGLNNIPRSFSITSTANLSPVWTTGTGTIATVSDAGRDTFSYSLAATDAENNSLTYALVSGSLPPNMTLSSSGVISGVTPAVSSDTAYTFVASVSDRINTVTRSFSIAVAAPIVVTLTSSGSWTAPAGVSLIKLLMVGGGGGGGNGRGNGPGGGGGGGGIIYSPTTAVNPGQTYSIVVGTAGGQAVAYNQSGGQGCVTTGFGATAGGGGGGVSEYNGNCNGAQGNGSSVCTYQPTSSVSGPTATATIKYDGGSGGCSFGAGGSGTTYTSSISGSSVTYGGVNGSNTYGSGGSIGTGNDKPGVVIISY